MFFGPNKSLKYVLFFLFVWTVVNFFPGSYNVDTWNQYFEMERNEYTDWHSPFFGLLWRVLYVVTDRFFSMYLLQIVWYYLFLYHLLKHTNRLIIHVIGIGAAIILVFMAQYLMKDTHHMLAWASTVLILFGSEKSDQRTYLKYMALIFVAYGLFLRPNSILAAIPILYIFIEVYHPKKLTTIVKLFLASAISVVMLLAYFWSTYSLIHTKRAYPEYKLRLMDIIGISKATGVNYVPDCLMSHGDYNHEEVFKQYSPATIDHIYWPPSENVKLLPLPTQELNDCVAIAWKRAIKSEPTAYLRNRYEGFLYYLRIKKRFKPEEYYDATIYVIKNNYIPIYDTHTRYTKYLTKIWDKIRGIHFFDPWVWLLLNIVGFVFFSVRYRKRKLYSYKINAYVQLSAIIFVLGTFPVFQIDSSFRYFYWNVIACLIGFIFIFRNKSQAKEAVNSSGH